jgi:hypothetical protein
MALPDRLRYFPEWNPLGAELIRMCSGLKTQWQFNAAV